MASIKLESGRYFLIEYAGISNGKQKQKWIPLTQHHASSVLMANSILNGAKSLSRIDEKKRDCRLKIISFVKKAVANCTGRASRVESKVSASISTGYIVSLLEKQDWRCAVTGIEFRLTQFRKHHGRPFAPSIDRIDSDGHYTENNVRLVCLAANYAMNQWGESVLDVMLAAYLNKKLKPEFRQDTEEMVGMDEILSMINLKRNKAAA